MKGEDGYYVTGDELAAFRDSGKPHWWMNADGSTDVYTDSYEPAPGWPVYLMSGSDPWFDQWAGDLERACAEQLNPALRSVAHLLPPVDLP